MGYVGLADGYDALGHSLAEIRDAEFFEALGGWSKLRPPTAQELGDAYTSAPEPVREAYKWAGITSNRMEGRSGDAFDKRGVFLVPRSENGHWRHFDFFPA